jgi:peptidoglycan/LPS O-acetylase OafA/YrhL
LPAARFQHQPSLDGLRAIAILLVIGYHTGYLPGGFVGVDLFFVLSGYLITSILLREWEEAGDIHLPAFYGRRLLRLAPALTVLVGSLAFVHYVVFPETSGALHGRWIAAALLYVSNLVIAIGGEYPLGDLSICWSLAMEEQFYLLWPLGLRASLRRRTRRGALTAWVLALVAVPFVLRQWLASARAGDPRLWLRLYFAPDTRADPILMGCALGLLLHGRAPNWPRAGSVLTLAAGAALVVFARTRDISTVVVHPWMLSLTAAASAVVLAGLQQGGPVARLLAVRPLVVVGRLSYSLYLWHIIGLGLVDDLGLSGRLAALVTLAAASYFLVERPFLALKDHLSPLVREPSLVRPWPLAVQAAAGAGVIVLLLAVAYGRTPSVQVAQAFGLLRRDDVEAAAARFESAARRHPDVADVWFGLGEVALRRGRLDEADAAFARAISIDPRHAGAHNGLGLTSVRRGDLEGAVRHFTEAARLRPDGVIVANLERAQAELRGR